jgi:hypothetical protein
VTSLKILEIVFPRALENLPLCMQQHLNVDFDDPVYWLILFLNEVIPELQYATLSREANVLSMKAKSTGSSLFILLFIATYAAAMPPMDSP